MRHRRPKDVGTAAETAVVRYARANGFPGADRLALSGVRDRGDVRLTTGLTAGVVVEVKGGKAAENASPARISEWLGEVARAKDNAGAQVAFLVTKRRGVGPANAGGWYAHFDSGEFLTVAGADVPPEGVGPVTMSLASALALLRGTGWA